MRISRLLAASAAIGAALSAGAVLAAEPGTPPGSAAGASDISWDDFDDPSFDPARSALRNLPASHSGNGHVVALGVVATDAEGRRGRIHTVAAGDTLWDISEAYLGTPWVWPSIWHENDEIANPHLIEPDDRIWISSTEMRRISESEAEAYLANNVPEPAVPALPASEGTTDLVIEPIAPMEEIATLEPASATAGSLSLATARTEVRSSETGRNLRLPFRENFGFISDETLRASSSIIGSPSPRTWLAGNDLVYLGLGEGEVTVGEEFTVFREAQELRDLGNGTLIGYHIVVLGWLRVVEVTQESAIALLKASYSEIERGDRVMPRGLQPTTIPIRRSSQATLGQIVFLPSGRSVMGMGDYVYLDRGELHGLEVGSEVEIFESGFNVRDQVRRGTVHTPDEVVASLVVVDLQPKSAVAYVMESLRELEVGDAFRSVRMGDAVASLR